LWTNIFGNTESVHDSLYETKNQIYCQIYHDINPLFVMLRR
jgi:hypothetical protein